MSKPVDRVEAEALQLSVNDRARLARRLLESLDESTVEDPAAVQRAWQVEIERRTRSPSHFLRPPRVYFAHGKQPAERPT